MLRRILETIRPRILAGIVLLTFATLACWFAGQAVLAQSGGFSPAAALQDTTGGVAQYGVAIQGSTSGASTQQVLGSWNTYVQSRAAWSFSSADISRVANADWGARQSGLPSITPQQLANAATQLINSSIATMSGSQQQSLYAQYAAITVPNGYFAPNATDPNITATQNQYGTWTVSVSPNEFSDLKAFFQQNAPGMMSSGSNFYPAEAVMVAYAAATGDRGYDTAYVNSMKSMIGATTGVDMTNQVLFGDHGYMVRRPMVFFFTESNLNQFFTSLGF